MVIQLPSSQVQQNFGAAVERTLRGEDVVIERYGTPRVALVEYGRYQQLLAAQQEQAAAQTTATQPVPPAQLHEAAVAYRVAHNPAPAEAPIPDDRAAAEPATYRYVTRTPGVCGGRAILRGTRVPVRAVAGFHKLGLSGEETLAALPHLTPAQVYEALSYYYDHVDEIEQEIRENQLAGLIERYGLQVAADGRITFVD
jgi:uncharacterized protein (DUF433 family)